MQDLGSTRTRERDTAPSSPDKVGRMHRNGATPPHAPTSVRRSAMGAWLGAFLALVFMLFDVAVARADCAGTDITTGSTTGVAISIPSVGGSTTICATDNAVNYGLFDTAGTDAYLNFPMGASTDQLTSATYTTSKARYTITPAYTSSWAVGRYTITLNSQSGTGTDTIVLFYADQCTSYTSDTNPYPSCGASSTADHPFTITVTLPPTASTTTVSAIPTSSTYGSYVVFTATVTGASSATGTMTFLSDGAALGSPVPVAGGQSSLPTSALTVGTHVITAIYSGDTNYAASTSAPLNYTVGQGTQATLTASASPTSVAVGATSALTTSGGTGNGAVTWAVTAGASSCSVSGSTLTALAVGTCTLTATKASDGNYTAATATVDVTVTKADQATLTAIATPASVAVGATSALTTSGGTGTGTVSYAVTAGASYCSISGSTLTALAGGTCTVTATKAADTNYKVATATVDVTVAQADQATLTAIATPASISVNGTSELTTSGGTGTGTVSYAVTAGASYCSISGSTLTGLAGGTCTVTATKAADANYKAATSTVDVTVAKLAQMPALVAEATPSTIQYGHSAVLTYSGGSGSGAVTWAVAAGTDHCTVSGATVTGTAPGTCWVTVTKAGDSIYASASDTVTITITKADQAALTAVATPSSIGVGGTSALSATGGTGTGEVTWTVTSGTSVCSVSGSTATGLAAGTCTLTATKAGIAGYFNDVTATVDVTVTKLHQTPLVVTATPSTIAYGQTATLSTTGGSGTGALTWSVVGGTGSCSISGTTLTGNGVGTCMVAATKAGDATYVAMMSIIVVDVTQAPQAALTAVATPAAIPYGGTTALSTTGGSGTGAVTWTVTAGASVCALSGTTVTATAAGTCTLTATKAADASYLESTATVDVTVLKAPQAPLTASASPATIPVSGTSSLATGGGSGTGAVTFAVTSGASSCSVSGSTLTGLGVGTCTVTATRAADANYVAATATVDVSIVKAVQSSLTATATPSAITLGETSTLGSSGGSGTGAVTFAVTAGASYCSVSGTTLTGLGVGTCTVTATRAADSVYEAATATVDVTVSKAAQTTLVAVASPTVVMVDYASLLSTTGGSGTGAVTFAVTAGTDKCWITGTTLVGLATGVCTVTATKAADTTYAVATATVTLEVVQRPQLALTATATPAVVPYGGTSELSTTGGSGTGAVTWSVTAGASVCSVSGTTVTATAVGGCTLTATKAGDATYVPISSTVDITVTKAAQAALTATATPAAITAGGTSTLATTGGSGTGAVTWSVTAGASVCSLSGTTLTGLVGGSCTLTATRAADANYDAATATVDVTVAKAAQTALTATATPSAIVVGNTSTLAVSGGSGTGAVTWSVTAGASVCSISGSTLTGLTGGGCTLTVTKASDASYEAATATVDVTVAKAVQTGLTASATPASIVVGNTSTLATTGGSGTGAVTWSVTAGASVCSLSGTTLTGLTGGSCTLTATKAADASYEAATATVDVSVAKAAQATLTAISTPSSIIVGGTSTLSISGGSGTGAVTWAVTTGTGVCSLSGTTLTGLAGGSCTLTATKAADASYTVATATVDVTVAKMAPTVTLAASSATVVYGSPVTLVATLSGGTNPSGTVTFWDGTTSLGTGSVTAGSVSLVVSSLAVGGHTITAAYGGDTANGAATSVATTVTVTKAVPSLALTSSSSSALQGGVVTFTATLTGGVSPTGSVIFRDGGTTLATVALTGGSATFSTTSLGAGSHTITAVYGGDGFNASVTSSAVAVTVRRSDPTADPTVRAMITSQVETSKRFAQTQIDNTVRRLEEIHDEIDGSDGDASDRSGRGAGARSASAGRSARSNSGAGGDTPTTASNGQASTERRDYVGPDYMRNALAFEEETPSDRASQSDAGRAIQKITQAFAMMEKKSDRSYRVWTAGSLDFGKLRVDGSYDNRFFTSGLTFGIDKRLGDDLTAGVALGYGLDHATFGSDGSKQDGTAYLVTLYGSWRLAPKSFLDVTGGYGALHFDEKRWSTDGNVMLTGSRGGHELFGSVGLTHLEKWGAWKVSGYGRVDVVDVTLDAYRETGSNLWALAYDKLETTTVSAVAGLKADYRIPMDWGSLTPGARLEYRHAFEGGFVQNLGYADLGNMPYALSGTPTMRDAITAGLSLRGTALEDLLMWDLEYLLTSDTHTVQNQQVKASVRVRF